MLGACSEPTSLVRLLAGPARSGLSLSPRNDCATGLRTQSTLGQQCPPLLTRVRPPLLPHVAAVTVMPLTEAAAALKAQAVVGRTGKVVLQG